MHHNHSSCSCKDESLTLDESGSLDDAQRSKVKLKTAESESADFRQ